MAFELNVDCKAYKDGPTIPVRIQNVPVDENEAMKMGLGRVMYDGWIRSLTIEKQDKARRNYKAPSTSGSRTKRGSAVNQAAQARQAAMREAAEQARIEAEQTETEEQIAS